MYVSVARMEDSPQFEAVWMLHGNPDDPLVSVTIGEDCNYLLTARELGELVRVLLEAIGRTPLQADHAKA
jgi:hypothetical protein